MKFTVTATFNTSAKNVYKAWLNSDLHSEMTGGEADITDLEGDTFAAWDGYITGENVTLEPYKKIVQTWRTTEFTDEELDSKIEITFTEKDGETLLTLVHTNLPPHGEQYRQGWEDHYFSPMTDYFNN